MRARELAAGAAALATFGALGGGGYASSALTLVGAAPVPAAARHVAVDSSTRRTHVAVGNGSVDSSFEVPVVPGTSELAGIPVGRGDLGTGPTFVAVDRAALLADSAGPGPPLPPPPPETIRLDCAADLHASRTRLAGAAAGPPSFGTPVRISAPFAVYDVALEDMNSDGELDVVAATSAGVAVLIGDGSGEFDTPITSEPFDTHTLAVADVNGDAIPDVAAADADANTVRVLLGTGDGQLAAAVSYAVGRAPASIAFGDLNEDGLPDLVTANFQSGDVSLLLGSGKGAFEAAKTLSLGAGSIPIRVAVDYLDSDAHADLAFARLGLSGVGVTRPNEVGIVPGDGTGGFGSPRAQALAGDSPTGLVVADMDADGYPDLVVSTLGKVFDLPGRGDGTFGPASSRDVQPGSATIGSAHPLDVDDFDDDGRLDVVVVDTRGVTVVPGTGRGFGLPVTVAFSDGAAGVASGDVNDDGEPDIVSGNGTARSFTVIPNTVEPSLGGAPKATDDLLVDCDEGDDDIVTGSGNDIVSTGAGNDRVWTGGGNDKVEAGAGDDDVVAGEGGDTVDLGAGDDRADLGAGDDAAVGGAGADAITGGAGNDTIQAGDGRDTVTAGDGNDNVDLGAGDDRADLGGGDDAALGGDGADEIAGGAGNDTLGGGAGNDTLDGGDGDDRLDGGAGNDTLGGGAGNDTVIGGAGNDTLDGGAGNDYLVGGPGSDVIRAGPGDDTIDAKDGLKDTIDCGGGTDRVTADAVDVLVNCEPPQPTRFTLTVTATGGTVASAPSGISLPAGGKGSFAQGTVVTLTATATAGHVFTKWTAAGCDAVPGKPNQVTCLMTASRAVAAAFAPLKATGALLREFQAQIPNASTRIGGGIAFDGHYLRLIAYPPSASCGTTGCPGGEVWQVSTDGRSWSSYGGGYEWYGSLSYGGGLYGGTANIGRSDIDNTWGNTWSRWRTLSFYLLRPAGTFGSPCYFGQPAIAQEYFGTSFPGQGYIEFAVAKVLSRCVQFTNGTTRCAGGTGWSCAAPASAGGFTLSDPSWLVEGLARDGANGLWLSLVPGDIGQNPASWRSRIVHATLDGKLGASFDLPGYVARDLAYDAKTFAPDCAVWANENNWGQRPLPRIRAYSVPCRNG